MRTLNIIMKAYIGTFIFFGIALGILLGLKALFSEQVYWAGLPAVIVTAGVVGSIVCFGLLMDKNKPKIQGA